MSLFIHCENQELLWKIIHRAIHSKDDMTDTFRQIIQQFHEKYPTVTTYEDLVFVNKQVLSCILLSQTNEPINEPIKNDQKETDQIKNEPIKNEPIKKETDYSYNNPYIVPKQDEIIFSVERDEPISNIEELVSAEMNARMELLSEVAKQNNDKKNTK